MGLLTILFISACAVEDCYLIERVAARYRETHVLRPVFDVSDRPKTATVLPSKLTRASRRILGFRSRLAARYLRRSLFRGRVVPLPGNLRDVSGWRINSPDVAAMVRDLAPDVIITSEAPIMKPEIYSQAKRLALNIHWGIAPKYRGNHTNFWALSRGDFDSVGATLHCLSEGIDRGGVLSRVYPAMTPLDHEFSIEAKLARMLPDALLDVLSAVESRWPLETQPQTEKGTLYLARQQTLRAVSSGMLRTLVRRPRRRPARIDRYF
jgi:hypothetical protein